jgi:hypothetical protein
LKYFVNIRFYFIWTKIINKNLRIKFKIAINEHRRLLRLVEQTMRRKSLLNNINQTSTNYSHRPFQLNTQMRAIKRREFNTYLKTKSTFADAMIKIQESEQKSRENQIIKSERLQTVFHAHSIKRFKPLIVKPSNRPLTTPESFNFHV